MGMTERYFRWTNNGWTRLSGAWFDRFLRSQERLEGADELRIASLILELDDRIAVGLIPPRFHRYRLQPDGTVNREQLVQGPAVILDAVLSPPKAEGSVVDATSRFELRRHRAETTWQPTKDQLEQLVAAIEKTHVSPRLARHILRQE